MQRKLAAIRALHEPFFSTFFFINCILFAIVLLFLQQLKCVSLRLFTKMIHQRNEFQHTNKYEMPEKKWRKEWKKNVNIKICFMTSCVNEAALQIILMYAFAFSFPPIRTKSLFSSVLIWTKHCSVAARHSTQCIFINICFFLMKTASICLTVFLRIYVKDSNYTWHKFHENLKVIAYTYVLIVRSMQRKTY